jgi:hypothetical protein
MPTLRDLTRDVIESRGDLRQAVQIDESAKNILSRD